MIEPKKLITTGMAVAITATTWRSAAVSPCDFDKHGAVMTCSTEPPELVHEPEHDQPEPLQGQRSVSAITASASSSDATPSASGFFGFAEAGDAAGFNQAPFFG